MTAQFINLDGIWIYFIAFGIYFLILLGLAVLSVVWLFKGSWRRWAGAGVLLAMFALGVAPTLLADWRGDRLGARMAAASFWPEELSFEGAHVLLVEPGWPGCGSVCETLFQRSGLDSLHVAGLDHSQVGLDASTLLTALSSPDTRVERIGIETGPAPASYQWVAGSPATLPADVDYIFILDRQGDFARANLTGDEVSDGDAAQIAAALYLYHLPSGHLDAPLAPELLARMFAGWRDDRALFLPMINSRLYSNDTTPFSNALEVWICGPLTAEWDDRCPYLF